MESTRPHRVQLDAQPGHAIRRLHQISLGIFHQETEDLNITPVQYAILQTVRDQPGCDQRTLAGRIALDTSTNGGARAMVPIGDNLELTARIENLFDEQYETAFRFGQMPRAGYVGVRLRI